MSRKTILTGALAACTVLALAAPASAQPDDGARAAAAVGASAVAEANGAGGQRHSERMAAGELNYALQAFQCTDTGGLNGRGRIGSAGYMEELGATNVTKMTVNIVTQARFTTRPFWRNVTGSSRTWSYAFGLDGNAASHSLSAPGPGLVWAYNYTLADDANNYIYRQRLNFTWSNATSRLSRQIVTGACFSD